MKTVLITGASAGFGKLVAEKLLAKGYTVYAAARRVERMQDLEAKGAHVMHMDVTDNESVKAGVGRVLEEQQRIDVLFNNAGYGSYGTIEDIPLEEIQRQYDVNVFGMGRLIQAVLPQMRQQRSGTIINTSSVVGQISTAVVGWYASTKHAVEAFSDALRMEVKPLGIDVVIIEPGAVKTEFDEVAFGTLDSLDLAEDYKPLVSGFRKYTGGMYAKCPGPEGTANAVIKAIEAKNPKTRYATTMDAKLLPRVKRLLTDKLFDKVVLSQMKQSFSNEPVVPVTVSCSSMINCISICRQQEKPMAGPAAGIILPEPLSQVQKNDIFLYLESIASQIRGKYDYSIEERPFLYTEGPETDGTLEVYIEEAVPEVIGWIPQDSISFAAMCNSEQDHRILGELCLYFAREFEGLVDFGAALGELAEVKGTLFKIPYEQQNGFNLFYHIGDTAFMEYWLQHPGFHMIKQQGES